MPGSEEPDVEFVVELRRSGLQLGVASSETVLEAILTVKDDVDFSCMRGECGSCVTTVIEGEIIHRDTVLSPRARAAGKRMAICVSRSATPRLVLDL